MKRTAYLTGVLLLTAFVAWSLPSEAAAFCDSVRNPDCPGVACLGYDQASRSYKYCTPDSCLGRTDCCDGVPPDEFYCP